MELGFWLGQLVCFNGQNIWHSPSAIRVVYSDASDTGYGGYMVEHGCHIAQGQWLPQEAKQFYVHGENCGQCLRYYSH